MTIAHELAYPTPAAKQYHATFVENAQRCGPRNIPDYVTSLAIDRSIERGVSAQRAGAVFADVYFRVRARREPRGGYANDMCYLMAVYSSQLEDKKGNYIHEYS